MLYLPVSRSWLLSSTAQRIYLVCAVLNFALIATFLGVAIAMAAAHAMSLTPGAAAIVKVLLFPEVIGTGLLWVAMWYFWFSVDPSGYVKRSFWFVWLSFFGWLAPVFYYFAVYRRGARRAQLGPASP